MSKAITIITLTSFLIGGAAVTSILARASLSVPEAAATGPVANRESKQDRLSVMSLAQASVPRAPVIERPQAPIEVLRQAYASAYASSGGADIEAAKAVEALSRVGPQPSSEPQAERTAVAMAQPLTPQAAAPQPTRPKAAARPAPQKSYALLSDVQIAGIKERLKLSSAQEYYWPGVETALRAIARKIHAEKRANPQATAAQLDPDCAEVQQLKSAAMPLLFQLREDQKDEVRKLARIIGLEKVAAAI